MVRINRTFNNNRSLRVSGHVRTRPSRADVGPLGVRSRVHTVLDGAHSRRIRTSLSLQLTVMYWLSFTAVRVAQDGASDCAQRPCEARSCAHHPVRRARQFKLT
jgi:hypothetical protein